MNELLNYIWQGAAVVFPAIGIVLGVSLLLALLSALWEWAAESFPILVYIAFAVIMVATVTSFLLVVGYVAEEGAKR